MTAWTQIPQPVSPDIGTPTWLGPDEWGSNLGNRMRCAFARIENRGTDYVPIVVRFSNSDNRGSRIRAPSGRLLADSQIGRSGTQLAPFARTSDEEDCR
jgi:hypothetical protein